MFCPALRSTTTVHVQAATLRSASEQHRYEAGAASGVARSAVAARDAALARQRETEEQAKSLRSSLAAQEIEAQRQVAIAQRAEKALRCAVEERDVAAERAHSLERSLAARQQEVAACQAQLQLLAPPGTSSGAAQVRPAPRSHPTCSCCGRTTQPHPSIRPAL